MMSPEIIVAIIGAAATILSVAVSSNVTRKDMMAEMQRQSDASDSKLDKAQAITDTKLEELTREVRLHNNFAQRIPVIEEQIKVANHRIDDLERKTSV